MPRRKKFNPGGLSLLFVGAVAAVAYFARNKAAAPAPSRPVAAAPVAPAPLIRTAAAPMPGYVAPVPVPALRPMYAPYAAPTPAPEAILTPGPSVTLGIGEWGPGACATLPAGTQVAISPCPAGQARARMAVAAIGCGQPKPGSMGDPRIGMGPCVPGGKTMQRYLTVDMPPVPILEKMTASGSAGYRPGQTQSDMDLKVAALRVQCAQKGGYLISTSFGLWPSTTGAYEFNCVPRTLVGVDFKQAPGKLDFLSATSQNQLRQFISACPERHTVQYNQCVDFASGYGLGKRCSFRCYPAPVRTQFGMEKNNPDAVLTPGVTEMSF